MPRAPLRKKKPTIMTQTVGTVAELIAAVTVVELIPPSPPSPVLVGDQVVLLSAFRDAAGNVFRKDTTGDVIGASGDQRKVRMRGKLFWVGANLLSRR